MAMLNGTSRHPATSAAPGVAPEVTVGIVGYSAVVESYPLGPLLMEEIKTCLDGAAEISVENFTWSPVHIVQKFQGGEFTPPGRMVLVGLAAESRTPGTVHAYRWRGGYQPEALVHERVYEAVTGIVDLENTLMIGDYFGVWPEECLTAELDLAPDMFGRLVMAENEGRADEAALIREFGFSPQASRQALVEMVRILALEGAATANAVIMEKTADMLAPVRSFMENHPAPPKGAWH